MKYAALTLLALALCIAGGWAAAHVINTKKELRLRYRVIIAAAVSTALAAVSSFNYLEAYYHADDTAAEYMKSSDLVAVEASESGQAYFFDGPGSGQAVIFYPGAKVDETAYAPLMFRLAEQGTDCFLLKLPFRMAILSPGAADDIIGGYDYDSWYLMGHSLGGIVAAQYNAGHRRSTEGVILLAAYPTVPVPDSEKLLSIYGNKDGCLSRSEYIKSKGFWPKRRTELIIEGGNHSGFAYYGPQAGDGEPSISAYEQQSRTVQAVRSFISTDR